MLAIVLVALAGLRFARLDADPSPLLASDHLTDEGWWAHNARNHALFGRWILDEHNPPLYGAPLWTAALRGSYAAFGVGLWQTRFVSALAGLATCALVYAFVRRSAGRNAALLATLVFGLDPFALAYHRSGFVEPFMVAWLTACLLALDAAAKRPALAALAGALFAGAVLAKVWAAGALVGPLGYWTIRLAQESGAARRILREAALFAAGGGAIAGVVLGWLVIPNLGDVVDGLLVHSHRAKPANPLHALGLLGLSTATGRLVGTDAFVQASSYQVLLLALLLARAFIARARWVMDRSSLLCVAWIASGLVQVTWQIYQPDRRWLVLGPALAMLL
ncbi:MAG TPA: glycosyltransferase family 39 protein, partial [Myxococcota bacterium]|nr:glycosyltransferase family 39 protein [Myxococcota bacterium]